MIEHDLKAQLDRIEQNQREIIAMLRASNNWLWPSPARGQDAPENVAE